LQYFKSFSQLVASIYLDTKNPAREWETWPGSASALEGVSVAEARMAHFIRLQPQKNVSFYFQFCNYSTQDQYFPSLLATG